MLFLESIQALNFIKKQKREKSELNIFFKLILRGMIHEGLLPLLPQTAIMEKSALILKWTQKSVRVTQQNEIQAHILKVLYLMESVVVIIRIVSVLQDDPLLQDMQVHLTHQVTQATQDVRAQVLQETADPLQDMQGSREKEITPCQTETPAHTDN